MYGVPKKVGPHRSVIGEGLEGQWHCSLSRVSNDRTSLGRWRGVCVFAFQSHRFQFICRNNKIKCVGRRRGVRLLLSRQFYRHIGQAGVYTRRRGLDRETNKELLLRHIQDNRKEGSQLRELVQVLPALSYVQVQKLLQELRIKGQIHKVGNTSAARWYPGGPLAGIMPK